MASRWDELLAEYDNLGTRAGPLTTGIASLIGIGLVVIVIAQFPGAVRTVGDLLRLIYSSMIWGK